MVALFFPFSAEYEGAAATGMVRYPRYEQESKTRGLEMSVVASWEVQPPVWVGWSHARAGWTSSIVLEGKNKKNAHINHSFAVGVGVGVPYAHVIEATFEVVKVPDNGRF